MKTYKSILNSYLFGCSLVIATACAAIFLDILEPYRVAFASTLGLPEEFLRIFIGVASLLLVLSLVSKLHTKLTQPLKALADECVAGSLKTETGESSTRELRLIRDYNRQIQDRATRRAEQISRMEAEIFATRKERDRSLRKIEEFEDLIASYGRIRKELSYDNTILRRENTELGEEVKSLQNQLRSSPARFIANR